MAEQLGASEPARVSFERALALWHQVPDAAARAPLDRVALLVRTAVLTEGPDPSRAAALVREAISLVDVSAAPVRAGLLYERLAHYSWTARDPAGAMDAAGEAVRLVPAAPATAARSRVLSGLGRILGMMDRPAESRAPCARKPSGWRRPPVIRVS